MELLKKIIQKVIFSFFLLYGYNTLLQPINLTIPINIYTVLFSSFFGIPSLLFFTFIKIIFFL